MNTSRFEQGRETLFVGTSRAVLRRAGVFLRLEQLEDRIAPIVGHSIIDDAPPTRRDQLDYTSVVQLGNPLTGASGSGSLLSTQRHILTAAHVIDGPVTRVKFEFQRPYVHPNVPTDNSDIIIPLGAGASYQIRNPDWAGNPDTQPDIGVIRLTDPVAPQPDKFLVAPFPATGYSLYDGRDEAGKRFEFSGYGLQGKAPDTKLTGERGEDPAVVPPPKRTGQNRFDSDAAPLLNEVQSVVIRGAPDAGDFKLQYGLAITPVIPYNATAEQMQTALRAAKIGVADFPLANNVDVRGPVSDGTGSGAFYFVEFVNGLANQDITTQIQPSAGSNTMSKAGVAVVDPLTDTRSNGNTILLGSRALVNDFDHGAERHDTMGLFYGLNNLPLAPEVRAEAQMAYGDSGGPAWLTPAGASKQVAGVVSRRWRPGYLPDVDGTNNGTFGEIGGFVRVSSFTEDNLEEERTNWLNETITDERYHIVLDMKYQVFGNTNKKTAEGVIIPDNITITAKRVGDDLQLWVDENGDGIYNPDPKWLEGMYFSEKASKINTLTIRGDDTDNGKNGVSSSVPLVTRVLARNQGDGSMYVTTEN